MTNCIPHNKAENERGYHRVHIPGSKNKRTYLHRLVYAHKVGVDIEQMSDTVVRHTCDNPRCINPDHLIGGTQLDNMVDMVSRGRAGRKLDWDTVDRIRLDLVAGLSIYATASKYGVSKSNVFSIKHGLIWKESQRDHTQNASS